MSTSHSLSLERSLAKRNTIVCLDKRRGHFVHGILILGGIFSAHMEYPTLDSPPTHSPEVDDSMRPATKPRVEKMGEVASFSLTDKMTMEVINMSNNEHYMLVVDAEATVKTIEPELRVVFVSENDGIEVGECVQRGRSVPVFRVECCRCGRVSP